MNFKPYPKYKDSGIEWLGSVPEKWEVNPLKRHVRCLDGKRIPLNSEQRGEIQGDIPYWGANGIVDHVDKWLFEEELVLLGEDGAPFFEPHKPVAFRVNEKVWINNHIHVLRPLNSISAKYLVAALNCVSYVPFIEGTTRDKLTQDRMNGIPVPVPPLPEQLSIAAFLDRETGRIDELIRKKDRQIELLQEKRQALISHAVTKGLDPKAKMKDSGIEWLGMVPQGWKVTPLKHHLRARVGAIKTGPFGSQLLSSEMESGSIKVYNQRNVIDRDFQSGDNFIDEDKFEQLKSFETFAGDLLVTTRGTIGRCAILPEGADQGILHPCLMRVQLNETSLLIEYLSALIQDSYLVKTQLSLMSNSTTIEVIYSESLRNTQIPTPPIAEQSMILDYLKRETARIDELAAKIRASIETLREYRTALISAAVTGKIDVREEV